MCFKKRFIALIFLLIPAYVSAQNSVTDSLVAILPSASGSKKVEILNELCFEYKFIQPSQSLVYGTEALELSQTLNDTIGQSDANRMLGILYAVQGDNERALRFLLQAVDYAEQAKATDRTAGLLSNVAGIYRTQGEYRLALSCLQKAYQMDMALKNPEAISYWNNAGILYKDLNLPDSALYCYEKRLDMAKKDNDLEMMATLNQNMANVYFIKKNYRQSIELYDKVLSYAVQSGSNFFEAKALTGLADAYFELKSYKQAGQNGERALAVSLKEGLLESRESSLGLLAKNCAAQKLFEDALRYQIQYSELKDSIATKTKSEAMAEMQVRFETKLKEQELMDEKRQHRAKSNILWLVSILSLAVISALWLLYRQKQLGNRLLQFEKNQLEKARQADEQMNKLKQEKLQAEVDHKNRELASTALHLVQKNEILQKVSEGLSGQNNGLGQLHKLVKGNLEADSSWKDFQLHFEQVHPRFFSRLEQDFPGLSSSELKLCSYIKINLANKEIAQLLNINTSSVEVSRYRLRKKMNLEADTQLNEFIRKY
jgi:tetratricopeptide (TPR) repeat protein